MAGPKIVDMGALPGGWQALQSASDSVGTFRRAEAQRIANEQGEQNLALNVKDEERRQAEEARRQQQEKDRKAAFDDEFAAIGDERKRDAADRELNVEAFKDEARTKITQGLMTKALASGFPVPPSPALVERMKRRLDVVRNAGPEGQKAAVEWMKAENDRDALEGSKRQLAVNIEDYQRLGVFGEDEAALVQVDELRDMLKDAESIEDIAGVRARIDALRTEIKRQRDVDIRHQQGGELVKMWTADISPADPRAPILADILAAQMAGAFSDPKTGMPDLVDKLFSAKYGRETARDADKRWEKALGMAWEQHFSDLGDQKAPTVDEVMAIDAMLQDPRRAQAVTQQAEQVQQTQQAGQAAAPAAPTRTYEDAKDELVEALRTGDVDALQKLDVEVGELTPEQQAELQKAIQKPKGRNLQHGKKGALKLEDFKHDFGDEVELPDMGPASGPDRKKKP